jgi:hypothetical protein
MRIQKLSAALVALCFYSQAALAQSAPSAPQNASAQPSPARPVTDQSLAAAMRLVRAMDTVTAARGMFNNLIPAVIDPIGEAHGLSREQRRRLVDITKEEIEAEMDSFVEAVARLYARRFSIEDLNAASDFFESDLGRRMTRETAAMAEETQAVGEAWFTEFVAPRINARLEELVRERRKQDP